MKSEVKEDSYNGTYSLKKGDIVEWREAGNRIEVCVKKTKRTSTWSEFDKNVI